MADYSMHSDRESQVRHTNASEPRDINDVVTSCRGEGSKVYDEQDENDPVVSKGEDTPMLVQLDLFELVETLGLNTMTKYYTLKAVEAVLRYHELWEDV